MDYETGDGSQFSLREEWSDDAETPRFLGTLITVFVDGNAYVGRSTQHLDDLEEEDVIELLRPIPPENIFPLFSEDLTEAPQFDMAGHYLKAPQFTYEDREPGRTFVADRLKSEAATLEMLSKKPHRSVVAYHGCVVKDERITHLCLTRCYCNLVESHEIGLGKAECERIIEQVRDGLEHLHALGIAHNDINPENVCMDASGHAIIVDFDSAAPFGKPLLKGRSRNHISDRENDFDGLNIIQDFLLGSGNNQRMEDDGDRSPPRNRT